MSVGTQELRLIYDTISQQSNKSRKLWIYQYRNSPDVAGNSYYCFPEFESTLADLDVMNRFISTSPACFQTFAVFVIKFLRDGDYLRENHACWQRTEEKHWREDRAGEKMCDWGGTNRGIEEVSWDQIDGWGARRCSGYDCWTAFPLICAYLKITRSDHGHSWESKRILPHLVPFFARNVELPAHYRHFLISAFTPSIHTILAWSKAPHANWFDIIIKAPSNHARKGKPSPCWSIPTYNSSQDP